MLYIRRQLEAALKQCASMFPVLIISGPRGGGKTTSLRRFLKDYDYINFDDFRVKSSFAENPHQFMQQYGNKIFFDEAHKAPKIFDYLAAAVKTERSSRRNFILAGPTQFILSKETKLLFANQMCLLSLLPFQYAELPKAFREEAVFRGSYPELINKKYQSANDWFSAYLETYLNSDLSVLGQVSDINAFRSLIRLLARDIGQALNLSTYAAKLKVEVKTIKRWIGLLEDSYIVFLLPPFYKNYGKRLVKSPKLYFYDTGLVSFLLGIENKSSFEKNPVVDRIFENHIVIEILKKELHHNSEAKLYYLCTNHGVEINLIVDRKKYKELFIIENADIINLKKINIVENFMGKHDKGYYLYRGEKFPASHIEIMPYKDYLLR